MLKKQLLFALRRLGRHKLITTINIFGLTFGVLSCLVIYLFVSYEFSYDNFHPGKDRIYRVVVSIIKPDGSHDENNSLSPPLAADLRNETTGLRVISALRTDDSRVDVSEHGKPVRSFDQGADGSRKHIAFVDPQWLEIFHYQWLAGDPATALREPFSVILTESQARLYFQQGGPADWMGRPLVYHDSLTVSVKGIVKDYPANSDLRFTDLLSYSSIAHSFLQKDMNGYNMIESDANAFATLAPGSTPEQFSKQFRAFGDRHYHWNDAKLSLALQPLADIHFNGALGDEYGRRAHRPTLFGLAGIALFILIIASINFINLSTAQAMQRAREVGVRKVLGSSRSALILQFLTETGAIVAISMLLALLLANPVIAALHGFIPEGVRFSFTDGGTWLFIGATVLFTCLLAGWYPARALSRFLPVITLRGQGAVQLNGKSRLRKGLIVFQFTVSLLFIIATMVVGRQIDYVLNTDLGFTKDAILTVQLPGDQPRKKKAVLASEVARIAGVQRVSVAGNSPEADGHNGTFLEHKITNGKKIDAGCDVIDPEFIPLYGLSLVAGRNFLPGDTTPGNGGTRYFILNETAVKALGFKNPAEAIGKPVTSGFNGDIGPILGVLKDFHSQDLHQAITPFFYTTNAGGGGLLSIKVASANESAGHLKELLANIQTTFKKVYPQSTFSARFFDESIAKLYEREQKTAQIMNLAMAIAIFISCMGLFGLAAFTANQRTREFGIRKVLGAGVPHLVSLLSREFVVLVVLSILIAAPIAGWAMHQWLQDFVYRTNIPWWLYGLAGVAAVAIALLTVSAQAIRAATANPVESLRSE